MNGCVKVKTDSPGACPKHVLIEVPTDELMRRRLLGHQIGMKLLVRTTLTKAK